MPWWKPSPLDLLPTLQMSRLWSKFFQSPSSTSSSPKGTQPTPTQTSFERSASTRPSARTPPTVPRSLPACSPTSSRRPQACSILRRSTRGLTVRIGRPGSQLPTLVLQDRSTSDVVPSNSAGTTTTGRSPRPSMGMPVFSWKTQTWSPRRG